MIFVHGNKVIGLVITLVLISFFVFGSFKLSEKQIELKKTVKEYEIIASELEESNNLIIKETEI